jgi:glycine betaine/choline ABC-type transport system substrate-binding protein
MSRSTTLTRRNRRILTVGTLIAVTAVPAAAAQTDSSDAVSRYLGSHTVQVASSPTPVSDNASSQMIAAAQTADSSDAVSRYLGSHTVQVASSPAPVSDNASSQALAGTVRPIAAPATIVPAKDGFDWGDAGIGAGSVLGASLLALLAGLGLSRRRRPIVA